MCTMDVQRTILHKTKCRFGCNLLAEFTIINVYITFTQSMCKVKFYTKLCVPVDAFYLCKFTDVIE